MPLNEDKERLGHIVQAIEEILEYMSGRTADDVMADRPLQHLLVHNLEIVGEAASRVSDALRQRHPEVPWREMVGMRNRLIHGYSGIDMDVVLSTVEHWLPKALKYICAIRTTEFSR